MIQGSTELTVDEIEPDYGTIRDAPVVNRLTLSYNRISQRYEVPNGGARPEIFKVRSRRTALTMFLEAFELSFSKIGFGV